MEVPEDQSQFIVPLSRLTEKIFYNKRFLIDARVDQEECRAWHVSKVNRIDLPGCALITLAQDQFDPKKDYIEHDEFGNVIGLWADYYELPVAPEPFTPSPAPTTGVITCTGVQEIKVGGSYKKFEVNFAGSPLKLGDWSFWIDGVQITPIVSTGSVEPNQIKIKLPDNGLWINKIMTVKYTTIDETVEFNISVVAL